MWLSKEETKHCSQRQCSHTRNNGALDIQKCFVLRNGMKAGGKAYLKNISLNISNVVIVE